MELKQAQALKVGDVVRCPAERGDPGYTGTVEHVGTHVTDRPVPFVWVVVRRTGAHASSWPSNRLG